MSNNPHRTHKRQKSSVLNPGYYFTPETKLEIQQQQPQQQESQQQQQQQQQQHSQTHNIYDNDNYMNYNFPPTSNRPRASTTTGTTSTTHPGSELSHESHSVHTFAFETNSIIRARSTYSSHGTIFSPSKLSPILLPTTISTAKPFVS